MMMVRKPRILFVFARNTGDNSTRFGGFVKRIAKNGGFNYADVDYVALEDLVFHIKNKRTARIYNPVSSIEVGSYSFVYFKSWQSMPELAACVAHFLEGKGIPYADHQVRHEYIAKTTNYMTMWSHGVAVPETYWGSRTVLLALIESMDESNFPLIIKAVHGQKGKDNHLAINKCVAKEILENAQIDMLLQQYIPNNGDYRIGVYGHKARWAIYRHGSDTSHLNNTSVGAVAASLAIKDVPIKVQMLAEAAADACDLAISGVDIVEDKKTKKLYVLEANQGSQIVTGAFTDTNMAAFDKGMAAMIARRFKGGKEQAGRLRVIGRNLTVIVKTPDGDISMRAKVDTGAYRSAIDAKEVVLRVDETGTEYVEYTLEDELRHRRVRVCSYDFGRARIRSSTGHLDIRYVVPITLEIAGKEYSTRVTLARRARHKHQILIGRRLLRGHFLVNVELGL